MGRGRRLRHLRLGRRQLDRKHWLRRAHWWCLCRRNWLPWSFLRRLLHRCRLLRRWRWRCLFHHLRWIRYLVPWPIWITRVRRWNRCWITWLDRIIEHSLRWWWHWYRLWVRTSTQWGCHYLVYLAMERRQCERRLWGGNLCCLRHSKRSKWCRVLLLWWVGRRLSWCYNHGQRCYRFRNSPLRTNLIS